MHMFQSAIFTNCSAVFSNSALFFNFMEIKVRLFVVVFFSHILYTVTDYCSYVCHTSKVLYKRLSYVVMQ